MGAIAAAVVGAGATYGLSQIGGGEATQGVVEPKETRQLRKKVAPWLQEQVGEGLSPFPGDLSAAMDPNQALAMSQLGQYMQQPGLSQDLAVSQFNKGIQGMTPQEAEAFHMKHYDPMVQRQMSEEILPGYKESQVAGGNLRSSGTSRGIGQIYGEMGANRMSDIGDMYKWSQGQANQLIPYGAQMSQWEGGMPQIEAGMKYGGAAQALEQDAIDRQVAAFREQRPELNPILDKALTLMGQNTNAYYQPAGASPGEQAAMGLAPAIGQYMANRPSAQPTPQYQQAFQPYSAAIGMGA